MTILESVQRAKPTNMHRAVVAMRRALDARIMSVDGKHVVLADIDDMTKTMLWIVDSFPAVA